MLKYRADSLLWSRHCLRWHRRHHRTKSSCYNKRWRFRRSRKTCRRCGRCWIDYDPLSEYASFFLFKQSLPSMREAWFGPSILLEVLERRHG